ncbi:MAG: hypothetical protein LZF86_20030 [Nitrospira sp.]|nr:MAG: hypothetical protein LZF86_20030 [Nitrospira sp.]
MVDTGHVECLDERPVMKQMAISKVLTVLMCALLLGAWVPAFTIADQATYIYDDLGRVVAGDRRTGACSDL